MICTKTQEFILITTLYILFLIFSFLYQQSMFNWSLSIAADLQSMHSIFLDWYFKIFALFGYPNLVGAVLAGYLILTHDKFNGFKLVFYIAVIGYLMSIIKGILAAPRPYFIDSNVLPYENYSEYGNPSGHAFVCVFGYGYLFYMFDKHTISSVSISRTRELSSVSIKKNPNEYEIEKSNIQSYTSSAINNTTNATTTKRTLLVQNFCRISKVLFVIMVFSICFGRIYLGMHGLNQVLFGLASGAYSLYVLICFLEDNIKKLFEILINKPFNDHVKTTTILGIIYLTLLILPIIIYLINLNYRSENEIPWWNQTCYDFEIMNYKPCSIKSFTFTKVFFDCAIISLAFGILFGFLISNGTYNPDDVSNMKVTKKQFILRTLVWGAIGLVLFGLYFIIPVFNDYILQFIFNKNLFVFLGTIFIIKIIPYIYSKLHLEVKGDIFKHVITIEQKKIILYSQTESPYETSSIAEYNLLNVMQTAKNI